MDREIFDLIARNYAGSVEPREFADWAIFELEKGRDSRSLRMLASEFDAKSYSDIEPHFRNSITELGWDFPDDKTAIEQYANSTMRKIVDGEVAPYDGCRSLYNLCIYLGCPKSLYNWNALYYANDEMSEKDLDRLIIDEARSQLNGEVTETMHEGCLDLNRPGRTRGIWGRMKDWLDKL